VGDDVVVEHHDSCAGSREQHCVTVRASTRVLESPQRELYNRTSDAARNEVLSEAPPPALAAMNYADGPAIQVQAQLLVPQFVSFRGTVVVHRDNDRFPSPSSILGQVRQASFQRRRPVRRGNADPWERYWMRGSKPNGSRHQQLQLQESIAEAQHFTLRNRQQICSVCPITAIEHQHCSDVPCRP
jgi:hypothetical protein